MITSQHQHHCIEHRFSFSLRFLTLSGLRSSSRSIQLPLKLFENNNDDLCAVLCACVMLIGLYTVYTIHIVNNFSFRSSHWCVSLPVALFYLIFGWRLTHCTALYTIFVGCCYRCLSHFRFVFRLFHSTPSLSLARCLVDRIARWCSCHVERNSMIIVILSSGNRQQRRRRWRRRRRQCI